MAGAQRFEELQAWQIARKLAASVYTLCKQSPVGRDFGLRNQLCRAAVSVMSNIAEGFARKGDVEFARYLDIARGSAAEVQSLLYASLDACLIGQADFAETYKLADEASRVIAGLSSYIRGSMLAKGAKKLPNSGSSKLDSGLRTPDPGLQALDSGQSQRSTP